MELFPLMQGQNVHVRWLSAARRKSRRGEGAQWSPFSTKKGCSMTTGLTVGGGYAEIYLNVLGFLKLTPSTLGHEPTA